MPQPHTRKRRRVELEPTTSLFTNKSQLWAVHTPHGFLYVYFELLSEDSDPHKLPVRVIYARNQKAWNSCMTTNGCQQIGEAIYPATWAHVFVHPSSSSSSPPNKYHVKLWNKGELWNTLWPLERVSCPTALLFENIPLYLD